ncbi:unnamed protein product [Pieris brassicae]|uniref:Uncharacterized protein n=1 Tax=Pieris brassicae TaxID=7116 RepID=A0A9P0TIX8_PIEBR|nr:unnamed protein product [Pieris brassicae]
MKRIAPDLQDPVAQTQHNTNHSRCFRADFYFHQHVLRSRKSHQHWSAGHRAGKLASTRNKATQNDAPIFHQLKVLISVIKVCRWEKAPKK